jgi:hypothetical protein
MRTRGIRVAWGFRALKIQPSRKRYDAVEKDIANEDKNHRRGIRH